MKKWLFICLLSFSTSNLFCQSLEWEVINAGLALGFPEDKNGYYNPEGAALTFGTAIRYNLMESQLSPGFDFTFSGWNRYASDNDSGYLHQNAHIFLLTTDYNYTGISSKFTPFGGLGVGCVLIREWGFEIDDIVFHTKAAFSPRIGFEVFKKWRFTTEYMHLGNSNNFFNFKIGFVIGS